MFLMSKYFDNLIWHPQGCDNDNYDEVPEPYNQWLMNMGSLTELLKSLCKEKFEVKVLSHSWGGMSYHEKDFLECSIDCQALYREVLLIVDGMPIIYGRTMIPSSVVQANPELLKLGDQPLGYFLFSQPTINRNKVEINKSSLSIFKQFFSDDFSALSETWGRRSLFLKNKEPMLLVYEFFLPHHLISNDLNVILN